MGALREKIAARLEENIRARAAWNEPPEIYGIEAVGDEVHLRPIQMPPGFLDGAPPRVVLQVLAAMLENRPEGIEPDVPPGMIGVAFYSEARLREPGKKPLETGCDRTDSDADAAQQPAGRYDLRLLTAVDRTGQRYYSMRRDEEEITTRIADQGNPAASLGGDIPEAMDRILAALLGVTVPSPTPTASQ